MRARSGTARLRIVVPLLLALVAGGAGWPPPVLPEGHSSDPVPLPPQIDSIELNGQGRGAQARFERTRALHAPLGWQTFTGPCDERLGRFCLTLGRDDLPPVAEEEAWTPPPEDPRVTEAREELLELLETLARAIPGDRWILEQRVAYLGEAGRWDEALELAERCGLHSEAWRCDALRGTALHELERYGEAERAFGEALRAMPPAMAEEWRDPADLVPLPLAQELRRAPAAEREALVERIWTLADPLFLVPGNDRWSEHLARRTLAMVRSDARNTYQMRWGDDLTELLVRYGPEVSFERQRTPALHLGPTPMVGRMHRAGRGMMPELAFVSDPAGIAPGAWRTDRRATRERHVPSYAERIGSIELQQARFRRGEELLLVVGWQGVESPPRLSAESSPEAAPNPPPGTPRAVAPGKPREAGLFLLDPASLELREEDAGAVVRWDPEGRPSGVTAARGPGGGYLVSVEVIDREAGAAWRSRHGVSLSPLARGVVALSDLVLLRAEGEAPRPAGTLEEEMRRLLPTTRLDGRVVEVGWEVYGVEDASAVLRYELTAEPVERGVLRRVAEFFRLADPPQRLEIGWEEGVPGAEDRVRERSAGERSGPDAVPLRTILLDLSSLAPGPAEIALTLHLPGREPVTALRRLVLE